MLWFVIQSWLKSGYHETTLQQLPLMNTSRIWVVLKAPSSVTKIMQQYTSECNFYLLCFLISKYRLKTVLPLSVILLQWPMNLCAIINKLEQLKLLEHYTWLSRKDQQRGVWELQCEREQSCSLCQECHHGVSPGCSHTYKWGLWHITAWCEGGLLQEFLLKMLFWNHGHALQGHKKTLFSFPSIFYLHGPCPLLGLLFNIFRSDFRIAHTFFPPESSL